MWKIGGGMCQAPLNEAVFGFFGKLGGCCESSLQGCVFFAKPFMIVLLESRAHALSISIIACTCLAGIFRLFASQSGRMGK